MQRVKIFGLENTPLVFPEPQVIEIETGTVYHVLWFENDRRWIVVQYPVPSMACYIGHVMDKDGQLEASYNRSVQHLPPEVQTFEANDLAGATNWLIEKAEARLEEGFRRLVKAIISGDSEVEDV